MPGHHFISYSPADAQEFVLKLADDLASGPPALDVWLDRRELQAGDDWDEQIVEAIRGCKSLLLIMTRDSVEPNSVCKQEWTRALKYKKLVIPLRLHTDAEMPFRLEPRQYIDFSGPAQYKSGLAQLRRRLQRIDTPQGALDELEDRLADAKRDLRRATDPMQQARVQDDITELERRIAEQRRVVEDPQGAAARVAERIARDLERERQPERPTGGAAHSKFINPPPGVAPAYFQDRDDETRLIGEFLQDDALRLITVVGRAGIGKTALVCRLLKALERGQLPGGAPLGVDGIVYLSAVGSRRVNVPNLYADLCKLLPNDVAARLDSLYRDPHASTTTKIEALLATFPDGRTVLLLDNFEDLIDPETLAIRDAELDEALRALLQAPQHAVKAILTTRIAARALALLHPERQARLHLDEGLESPYAENILRAKDADGRLGLRDAPDALLAEARERTRGYPRALEALFAILAADRDTALHDILSDTAQTLPEHVVEALVGQAFSRLDAAAQQVLQALAVYNSPVTPAAVDYLLQPYMPGVNSAPVLGQLVNMQFARKEAGRYYLHPVDRAYAFGRIPEGEKPGQLGRIPKVKKPKLLARLVETSGASRPAGTMSMPAFTQFALLRRGAEYFRQARTPRASWKTLADLAPQLAEFELRYAGQEYEAAAEVLSEIDGDYLSLWGHYRLMAGLYERLQGKLSDPRLKQRSVGSLGLAYESLGQYQRAITCFEQALGLACEQQDRRGEGAWLGNLGGCYAALRQTARAIECQEQALAIAREIGARRGEGTNLGNLGNRYAELGQTERAIDYYQQALAIACEIRDRVGESNARGNLGNCYAELGQTERAIDYHQQALAIDREIGYRRGESQDLENLAMVLIDEGRYSEAMQCVYQSIKIGEEIGSPGRGSWGYGNLALARLYAGDLPAARAAAEAARQYDEPENNHNVLALLGLIALRQSDHGAAREAFAAAVAQADALLAYGDQNYGALDAKGLALSGLALCEGAAHVPTAITTYRAARAINKDAGVVGRVLRLLDALAVADADGVLAGVRAAAGGEG